MALVKVDVGLGITVYHIPLSQPTSAVHWMRVYKAGGSLGRGRDLQSGPQLTTESIKETNFCKAVYGLLM